MRRIALILGAVLALGLAALWVSGGFAALQGWVMQGQREVQTALAGAVRAIRQGQPGAMAGLLAVCFGYGVLHAAGPGHGKVLIGGYGMGRRVPFATLSGISLAASLAQSAVAVALVYAGVAVLGWTRDVTQGVAERVMAPAGTAAIGAVGLWLMWRGARGIWRARADFEHQHQHDAECGCGHAHGPSVVQVQAASGWADRAALVAGVAMRPCSGALFLLILTWQLGIGFAGIAGTFAMGFGTAVVTVGIAGLAVWAREGALASLPFGAVARVLPWFEVLAGGVVAAVAFTLLAQVL